MQLYKAAAKELVSYWYSKTPSSTSQTKEKPIPTHVSTPQLQQPAHATRAASCTAAHEVQLKQLAIALRTTEVHCSYQPPKDSTRPHAAQDSSAYQNGTRAYATLTLTSTAAAVAAPPLPSPAACPCPGTCAVMIAAVKNSLAESFTSSGCSGSACAFCCCCCLR